MATLHSTGERVPPERFRAPQRDRKCVGVVLGRYDPVFYAVSPPPKDPSGFQVRLRRVMRGGSYICHSSHCRRYRVAARHGGDPESSTGDLGFRVVANA